MLKKRIRSSPTLKRGVVETGQLVLATVLLIGVLILGYSNFQQSNIALYAGIMVIAAGCLHFVVHYLVGIRTE